MKGECWWITGASSGIGKALALEIAKGGARLVLSGRNLVALNTVAEECGSNNCLVLPFEATDYAAIPAATKAALDWAGRIDCLVNNAGISQRSLAVDTSFAVYEKIIAVDLLAPIALTQALLPHMVAAGGGRLIAISSVAGIAGVPLRTAYCAAKHGIFGYFDALRAETAHLGVQVHVVAPGSVKTNVSRNALNADASVRGQSDAAIEAGLPSDEAAKSILAAVALGQREILVATGAEAQIAKLRRENPDAVFDMTAAIMARGYAQQMTVGQPAG